MTRALLCLTLIASPAIAADRIFYDSMGLPCQTLPGVLHSEGVIPYSWWTGHAFGEQHTWTWGVASNHFNPLSGEVERIGVRSYAFTAPETGSGKLSFPSTTAGISVSIGTRCGSFDNIPSPCIGVASSAIQWTTDETSQAFKCRLTPGQTYYLNYAWIIWTDYVQDAGTTSTSCMCPGPNCVWATAVCQFGHNSVAGGGQ